MKIKQIYRIDPLSDTWRAVQAELEDRRDAIYQSLANTSTTWDEVLVLRGEIEAIRTLLTLPERGNFTDGTVDY